MGTGHEVTTDDTAVALGSGDVDVLGTPRLLAWLEAATVEAARPHLGEGQTSVGTAVRIRHKRPTPVGGTVTVSAELREEPSGGRLGFTVSARDGDGTVVGDGEIDRVIVEREGFGA
jgi:fluoroacetyl-CoA thioesterase